MTGILAVGRHAGPFLGHPTHVAHVGAEVIDDLAVLHAVLAELLALQGPVLVIHLASLDPQASRAIATVRSALDGAPILSHATALPPLAADVLVTLAAAMVDPIGGAAVVAAALPDLERQLIHLSWVPSVARLTAPAPTVWQHARSALPGTSWLVSSWPEPAIRVLDLDDPPPMPRASGAQQVGIALADLDGDISWVTPVVSSRLPQAVGTQVEPPPDSATWWGSRRVTQVVLYPRAVEPLAAALRASLDVGHCRWCRRLVGATTCPWCRLPRDGTLTAARDIDPGPEDRETAPVFTADHDGSDRSSARRGPGEVVRG